MEYSKDPFEIKSSKDFSPEHKDSPIVDMLSNCTFKEKYVSTYKLLESYMKIITPEYLKEKGFFKIKGRHYFLDIYTRTGVGIMFKQKGKNAKYIRVFLKLYDDKKCFIQSKIQYQHQLEEWFYLTTGKRL